jgi:hypothetical protein
MAVFVAAKIRPAGDTKGVAKDREAVISEWLWLVGLSGHKHAGCEDMVVKKPP